MHSAAVLWQDGVTACRMTPAERCQYLRLRPALNWKPALVVYDIGANEGQFASFVAKLPSVAAIYSFEPVRQAYAQLARQHGAGGKVRCFPVALADRCGRQQIHVNRFSPSSSLLPIGYIHVEEFPYTAETHEEEVRVTTLRAIVQEHALSPPDFVKIDVQGYEDRVILGGEEILQRARFCMLELSLVPLYEGNALITDVNALMRRLGFRLMGIVGEVVGQSGEIVQIDGLFKNIGLV